MTTETVVTREVAHFHTREPRSKFAHVVRETALLHGHATVTPGAYVREVFRADDAYQQSAYSLLREVARVVGTADPSLRYVAVAHDVFRSSDTITSRTRAIRSVREVAHLLGRAKAPPSAKLHETFRVNEHVSWFSSGFVALRERLRVSDAVWPGNGARLHEVARLDDHLRSFLRQRVGVREIARFQDIAIPGNRIFGILQEVATLNDHTTTKVTFGGGNANKWTLREVFYSDDRAIPPNAGRAYTCHILSWGLSEYRNYPFLTRGAKHAAGQNLWRLDAIKDYNSEVTAWITTGMMDIGTAHGKRPSALYASGSSSEPLGVVVSADVGGQLKSYDYVLDLRDQTNYRNNRCLLGKGFRSRYLQFRLQAPKYLGFRLLTAEVDVAPSPRRVG